MQKNVAGTVRGVVGHALEPLNEEGPSVLPKNTRLFLYNQRVARITGGSRLGSIACVHIFIETPVHLTMRGERFRHTTRVLSHIQRNKVTALQLATPMILVKFVSTSLFLICLILHNLSVFLFTYKASILFCSFLDLQVTCCNDENSLTHLDVATIVPLLQYHFFVKPPAPPPPPPPPLQLSIKLPPSQNGRSQQLMNKETKLLC